MLAAFLAENRSDVVALSRVDAGDALAIATRFDCQWAYRGGQALLWSRGFTAREVHDLYLPIVPMRPFDRRGLLRVDGYCDGRELHLFATEFAQDRGAVRDLRFARTAIRAIGSAAAVLFVASPARLRAGFKDLGFSEISRSLRAGVWARGYDCTLTEITV